MRLQTKAAVGIAAAAVAFMAGAAQAQTLEIKDAVARVTVIPEARKDIKVEVVSRNPSLPLSLSSRGDRTVLDGGLARKIRNCTSGGQGSAAVTVAGVGRVEWDEMPQIVIRTPKDVVVEAGGAVFGSVGRSASLKLSSAGCGDWTVANVAGRLDVNLAGSGDIATGTAAAAKLRLAGSGDIDTRNVAGAVEVDLAGSGDVDVGSVNGPLDIKIAGSGDVEVAGGEATAMTVSVAGSGGVTFDGQAASLKARVAGSGDVRVKSVKGEVSKSVLGSGTVEIG